MDNEKVELLEKVEDKLDRFAADFEDHIQRIQVYLDRLKYEVYQMRKAEQDKINIQLAEMAVSEGQTKQEVI